MSVLIAGCVGPIPTDAPAASHDALEQRVTSFMDTLFQTYADRDLYDFMDHVSNNYLGNRARLESALDDRLKQVDSIRYEYFIQEIAPGENHLDVEFRWDRRWRDVDTGNETRRSNTTTFRLEKLGDRWELKNIRGNNPFL